MIGDTDFFIDLMHPRRPRHVRALAKVREVEGRGERIRMTAITRFELATGIAQFARREEERKRVERLLRVYPTYAVDGQTADRAGAVHGFLRSRGQAIGVMDAFIAGIALEKDEILLTCNERDFSRVEGLSVETY